MIEPLTKVDIETAEKILALLDGLTYAKALDVMDCAYDLLKLKAFVHAAPTPVVPADTPYKFETMWKKFNQETGKAPF